jgi:hypothetical protein
MKWHKFDIDIHYDRAGSLSVVDDMALRRLVDVYYMYEEPLTANVHELAESIDLPSENVKSVLEKFFQFDREANCWRDPKIDRDLMNRIHQRKTNRRLALLGGRPKKQP